eukprot:sb/3462203/
MPLPPSLPPSLSLSLSLSLSISLSIHTLVCRSWRTQPFVNMRQCCHVLSIRSSARKYFSDLCLNMLSLLILVLALTGYTVGDEFFIDGSWKEITNNINFPIEHDFLTSNLQFRTNRTLLRPNWQHDVKGTDHDATSANEIKALAMTFINVRIMLNAKWKLYNDPNGDDVDFFRCIKKNYLSEPVCGGEDIQIWTWEFVKGERMNLYCYDQLEFYLEMDPRNRICKMFLDQDLGDVNVRYMAKGHWRSVDGIPTPAVPTLPPTTQAPTEPATIPAVSTTAPEELGALTTDTPRITCDCWTAECGWCSDEKCRVSHELTDESSKGIHVESTIKWVAFNTVYLFDSNGDMIGSFRFNRKGIFLTGCVNCMTPRPLPWGEEGVFHWNVAMEGNELVLYISEEELWRQELVGECAERYSDIQEFAFGDIGCSGVWYEDEMMESGSHFTDNDTARIVGNAFWALVNRPEEGEKDVKLQQCGHTQESYNSDPVCGGQDEQIWSWNFNYDESLTLSCYDSLEYSAVFLPDCPIISQAKIDRLWIRHMKGFYFRAWPKNKPLPGIPGRTTIPVPPAPITTPAQHPTTDGISFSTTMEVMEKLTANYKTCDCWTAECGWCEDPACTVAADLTGGDSVGITVTSTINYKNINTVFFLDSQGIILGSFQFNRKGVFLTGCVKCATPRPFPKAANNDQVYEWNVQFDGSDLVLSIFGVELWRQELIMECADVYADVQGFGFTDIGCEGSWSVSDAHVCIVPATLQYTGTGGHVNITGEADSQFTINQRYSNLRGAINRPTQVNNQSELVIHVT